MSALRAFALALLVGAVQVVATPAPAVTLQETPSLADAVAGGALPPVAQRVPAEPAVVDLAAAGKRPGVHGGSLHMIMGRAKDTRQMVVYGYARLVAYDPRTLEPEPDILRDVEIEGYRSFTFVLREGHRWSDGAPFTAEDFRYWWENVANNEELSPTGPPSELLVDGEFPTVTVLSPTRVRYAWSKPNPDFLHALAGARPLYLYTPSHYLKRFHRDFVDPESLAARVEASHQRSWAALHNKLDSAYKFDNPELPTLQPWQVTTAPPTDRFVYRRNPFYHRVDPQGRQLPYIDEVVFQIAATGLIPAKTGTGEAGLQARYLSFDDYTFLRQGEQRGGYETYLWRTAKGAHLALYPNLNVADPEWQALNRDVRFRRALSLAVNRHEINQVIYFGLAHGGNNTVLPDSPLYRPEYRRTWAEFDPARANRLLDEIGLTGRDGRGVRLLPDGRPLDLIVETDGESTEQSDVLQLVHDSWLDIGVKLYIRPSQRTVFRNRIYAGQTVMAIASGMENGLVAANSSPQEFAPLAQTQYMWPKWGQYVQTKGKAGEPPDLPEAERLLALYGQWRDAGDRDSRLAVWREILSIWTDQVYSIGLISGVLQPVVTSLKLHNVPVDGIYNWDPGAHFGMYRPDTFFFGPVRQRTPEERLGATVRERS